MSQRFDTIVVGGGAAALTASLFAARRGLKVVTLAEDIGGQAAMTARVENYPGIEPTDGLQLLQQFRRQAERNGATVRVERVEKIQKTDDAFTVTTVHDIYDAPTLILAFGLTHRKLNVPGEERLLGHGISYCSICDAPLFKGKAVAVIGGGNSGMDAALALANFSPTVTLITKHDALKGEQVLIDRVTNHPKIAVATGAVTKEVLGKKSVTGLTYEVSGQVKQIEVEGVFVEVGFVVSSELMTGLVDLDERNQVIIHHPDNSTSVPGLFAAGDITNITQKQIVISAGEGAKAGIGVAMYLERLGHKEKTFANDWTHVEPMRHEHPPQADSPVSQK